MIRNVWNLPNTTHKYFIEQISESPHLKTILCQRFLTFINSIRTSKKKCLSALAEVACCDQGSSTCQNLNLISELSGLENILEISPRMLSQQIVYEAVPESEAWRVPLLKELLSLKSNDLTLPDNFLTKDELEDLIRFTATS